MVFKDVVIIDGAQGRFANALIQKTNSFQSSIWMEKDERRVNAKSLLGVLSLSIQGGDRLKLIADGSDEQKAINELAELILKGDASQD